MEPPIAQRPGYPLPQGCHPQMQTNGRAVRGGRSNFAQMQPNDSYAHYNQWPGVNPNSWNPAAGPPGPPGSQPWAQQPVSWNGAGPANHPGNQTGNGHSAHLSNLAAQPGMPWPPDQTGQSANGWMSSAWGPQVQNNMSANNRMQSIGEDVSLYNSSQNRKPRPTWDALCFAALTGTNSASNQNDLVGSLETWNHPAAAAAAATNALCQLTPMQIGPGNAPSTDWSQVAGTPGNSATAHWMGMNSTPVSLAGSNASEGVTSNLTSGYLNDHSAPHPHQNGATLAAVAAAFGIGGSGAAPVPPHWTASGPSGDPNSMKLEDSIYRSSTNCGLSVPNTPGTMQHPNGLISGDWRTAATPVAGFHTAAVTPQAAHQHLYKR
ncbi:hypothetical protein FGIG_10320 [Fasciola gigantica]|uniref:Uncharacterized protein n=1 Tax=Fasciola gigantica TaxID=46835 RepID=A0A504YGN5_FASGI|nr:hypothetical protein FGIG_10320 [Fasciola gigantica]